MRLRMCCLPVALVCGGIVASGDFAFVCLALTGTGAALTTAVTCDCIPAMALRVSNIRLSACFPCLSLCSSDFSPYGGWTKPAIKQFNDGPTVCGVGVDHN